MARSQHSIAIGLVAENGTGASPLLGALAAPGLCPVRRRRRLRPGDFEAA